MKNDMRHRITFRSRGSGQNAFGEELDYSDVKSVWASVEKLLGREMFAAQAVNSSAEVKFRCHYQSDINEQMRIVHNDVHYDILSIANVMGLNRETLIYAKKVM